MSNLRDTGVVAIIQARMGSSRLPTFKRPESTAEVVTEVVVEQETPEEETVAI
jgi:spore coat polysaccharide biosynthesis protein SpsF (cytidylyltransferase family)